MLVTLAPGTLLNLQAKKKKKLFPVLHDGKFEGSIDLKIIC